MLFGAFVTVWFLRCVCFRSSRTWGLNFIRPQSTVRSHIFTASRNKCTVILISWYFLVKKAFWNCIYPSIFTSCAFRRIIPKHGWMHAWSFNSCSLRTRGHQISCFYTKFSSFCFFWWKLHKLWNRVLDNLKDYAVRALVNAVDHLGTVAYKLTDLLEQQTVDVSAMELKVTCVNQVSSWHLSLLSSNEYQINKAKRAWSFDVSNFLHAKLTRIKKVLGSNNCWHSFRGITSTTFYQVRLNVISFV